MCFVCKLLDAINEYQGFIIVIFTAILVWFTVLQHLINKKQSQIQEDQLKANFFKLRFDFFKGFISYVSQCFENEEKLREYGNYKAECRLLFNAYEVNLVNNIEVTIRQYHKDKSLNVGFISENKKLQALWNDAETVKDVNMVLTLMEQSFAQDFNFSKYFKNNDIVDIDLTSEAETEKKGLKQFFKRFKGGLKS
ncbi:hypothetical protein ACE1ET_00790 [Saccharicrinis sp. FJH62]|uniref:hypothetical protein n=1 Tax=Saccharicrinis sp. FJH62 TaxID=3344657 RepID=UPI0035D3F2EA